MLTTQQVIDGLLEECERQAKTWQKIRPDDFDITDPFRAQKNKILYITLGYIYRMLELYHDTILSLEDDRLLSGVILARASVECAAMVCLFHEQIEEDFWPSPSPSCMRNIEKHLMGTRVRHLK